MTRKALDGAQVGHKRGRFALLLVRIGVGVARDLSQGIKGPFGGGVIAKHPVAAAHLLKLPQDVGARASAAPHLFALHEQRIPMIILGIHRK